MPPSQRRRRAVDDDDEDEEERPRQRRNRNNSDDESGDESANEMEVDGRAGSNADDQLAKKFVRYALACEYSRTAIRRDGIKERVLGNQGRSFKRIFALAQSQLRNVWGMELRELPVREKMSLHEKRQAMKSNAQPKTGSGSYILSSTLPPEYRDASILKPSKTPSADDEATYTAFYTMVVSLIYLNANELSDQKLQRYLVRLNADQNVSSEKTELTLKRMERQGYLIKNVERPPVGQDGEHVITWHVGPRAKEEIGKDGVIGMVQEVYGDWNPDLDRKLMASLDLKDRSVGDGDEAGNEADGRESREQTAGDG